MRSVGPFRASTGLTANATFGLSMLRHILPLQRRTTSLERNDERMLRLAHLCIMLHLNCPVHVLTMCLTMSACCFGCMVWTLCLRVLPACLESSWELLLSALYVNAL